MQNDVEDEGNDVAQPNEDEAQQQDDADEDNGINVFKSVVL